jgi:predicted MFS family arabinose efflux permease
VDAEADPPARPRRGGGPLAALLGLYRGAYSGLPRAAWLLAFAEFVNRSGSMVLFFSGLYLTRHLHASLETAAGAMSLFGLGGLVGSFLGGKLCDLMPSPAVQALSLTASGLLALALGQASTVDGFFGLLFAFGLASQALFPAVATTLTRVCPPAVQRRGFALRRLATNLGVSLGPSLGGFLALRSYRLLFAADGATSLLAAGLVVVFFSLRAPAPAIAPDPGERARSAAWRDAGFLALMGLVLAIAMIFSQIFSTLPLYLQRVYGFSESRIGLALAVNTILIVAFEMPLHHRLSSVAPPPLVALGGLALGAGYALMPWGRSFPYAALTVAVWTIGEILTLPVLNAVVAARAGDARQGEYQGIFSLVFSLAFAIGPFLGSRVYAGLGATALWSGIGVLGLLLAVGLHRVTTALGASE